MTKYTDMRRRERQRTVQSLPRRFFMRNDGWTHAQSRVFSPTFIILCAVGASVAVVYLLARTLMSIK